MILVLFVQIIKL